MNDDFIIKDGVLVNCCYEFDEEHLRIPDGVTEIGEGAFSESGIVAVRLPKGIKRIGESAFQSTCLEHIVIPEGLKSIDDFAFDSCQDLCAIKLPETLTVIGNQAFGDTGLKSIRIPDSVVKMGEDVFEGNADLKNVVLPSGIKSISPGMFLYCSALKSIVIPEGVTTIMSDTFYKCTSLKEVIIPDSLQYVHSDAFDYCPSDIEFKKADGSKVDIRDYKSEPAIEEPEEDEKFDEVEIWERFESMSDEERAHALDTSFEFGVDSLGFGWEYPEVTLNGEHCCYRVSYIGPTVSDFCNAVIELKTARTLEFTWLDEPGEYEWLISRNDEYVFVKAPYIREGAYMRFDDLLAAISKGIRACDVERTDDTQADPVKRAEELLEPTRRSFDSDDPLDCLNLAMDTREAVEKLRELWLETQNPEVRMYYAWALKNASISDEIDEDKEPMLTRLKELWESSKSLDVGQYYANALFSQPIVEHSKLQSKNLMRLKDLWEDMSKQVASWDKPNPEVVQVIDLYSFLLGRFSVYCKDISDARFAVRELGILCEKAKKTDVADDVEEAYEKALHNLKELEGK